ncbi:MAG: HD domain-containing phosphohydrolase [Syntrophorhabdales bacterium]|jgi:HD-GYP domain-containing protein (c-di-GMP phosphodiesterase class II)
MNDDRYMAIPPGVIIPGSLPNFKVYIPSKEGRYVLWAREGNKVNEEQLARLSSSGVEEVFLDLDEEFKYDEYLETHLGDILENQLPSEEQKAAIFGKVSTNVVKDAFEESLGFGSMGGAVMLRTEKMIKNALMFIAQSRSLQALAKMIGHDYKTYEHATKVLWFTMAFLRDKPDILERIEPGYPTFDDNEKLEMLRQCGVGALLHDIGKAFVSQEILNKNGPLSEIEWEIMKRHPLNGLAMLLDADLPAFVKKAVLHHHEDFSGDGYPMSLEGMNISVLARVLRIIDTFDAMTSRRPYKDPIPPLKAMQIMVGIPTDKKGDGNGNGSAQSMRDQGMRRCFDEELLKKFIIFLGTMKLDR